MNTMLKLATLGALLACAGVAGARDAAPLASVLHAPGPVHINPQPLPPSRHDAPEVGALGDAAHAALLAYRRGPIGINPQPLPPHDPRPA
jgi:hypothetical protein